MNRGVCRTSGAGPLSQAHQHQGQPRARRSVLHQAAALLLLAENPTHGFMLHRWIVDLLGTNAPASKSRTYEVLNRLREADLIAGQPDPTSDYERQERLRYVVTPQGRSVMTLWVAEGLGVSDAQDVDAIPETEEEFLIRLRCAGALGDLDGMQQLLDDAIAQCQADREALPPVRSDLPTEPKIAVRRMLDRRRELGLQLRADWLEVASAMVLLVRDELRASGR